MQKWFKYLKAWTVLVIPVLFGFGPCGPIAGGKLDGPVVAERVSDFRFVDEADQCAIEVNPPDPHSVTVNCWAVGKQLFIGCMDCEGKTWAAHLEKDPFARVRINDSLYPVKASRMSDQIAIQRAWEYRWKKYEEGTPEPLPQGYWLYHMGSKPQG